MQMQINQSSCFQGNLKINSIKQDQSRKGWPFSSQILVHLKFAEVYIMIYNDVYTNELFGRNEG